MFRIFSFVARIGHGKSLIESLQRPMETPPRLNDEPFDVKIGVYIESLGKFRETEMVAQLFACFLEETI